MKNITEELFPIVGYSKYAITKTGRVFNVEFEKELTGSKNPAGYHLFRLTSNDGKTLTWGRHRLLAFVFLDPPYDHENYYVNHKNGIKGDDFLDNLEWITPKGNVEHAGLLGITDKCIPVSVRCIDTLEVLEFSSIVECAKYFNLSKDAVAYRVNIGDRRIFPERRQYRKNISDLPWYEPISLRKELSKNGKAKSVLVRNVVSGEKRFFKRTTDLALFLNTTVSTITKWLKLHHPVVSRFYQIKEYSDVREWREITCPYSEIEKTLGKRIIEVYSEKEDRSQLFFSATECAKEFNLLPTTLSERLKFNGEKIYPGGFRFKYKTGPLRSAKR